MVWDGREPVISWDECKRQVHVYPEAKYKDFATEAEAREAFCRFIGILWVKMQKENQPTKEQIIEAGLPEKESIAVDAV